MLLRCFVLLLLSLQIIAFPGKPVNNKPATRVVVTGAGNSVGKFLFQKLVAKQPRFYPVALVRNKQDARELLSLPGVTAEQVRIGDITDKSSIHGLFEGAQKAVLCTSATPKRSLGYKIKNFFRSIVGKQRPCRIEELYYPPGQSPYFVDFVGQKNIIDECVASQVEHIVMLSNMGGYRTDSKINSIGRDDKDPNSGNLFKWKRAAERYLMKRCFFTIIHAGALTDEPGGHREIVWDNDDALLRTNLKRIPKEDAAEVLLQALLYKEAIGRSIDVAARSEGTRYEGLDWLRFWSIPGNNVFPADI